MAEPSTTYPRAVRRGLAAALVACAVLALAACAFQTGPFEGFADSGPAADVATVRQSLPGMIGDEDNVGRAVLDDDGAMTAGLNLSAADVERRSSELSALAAPSRVSTVLPRLEEGIATLVAHPDTAVKLGFTQASFTLDEFAGIDVDGEHATAVLSGKECYTKFDAAVRCGPPSRFRLTLLRSDDGAWLIERKRSQPLPG